MVENDDGGILSAEQVAEPRAAYPTPKTAAERAKERREAARQRKRDQRARDKAEKETQAAMSQAETIKDFWNESLKTADPAKLAEWEERQERVLDTLHWMESWVNGTYNVSPDDTLCYVGLEEGIADLETDVAKHGLTIIEVTLIPFWKPEEKDFFQRVVNRGGPTEVFIRYGIIVGIPEHRYGVFHEKFIQKLKALTSYASTLSCLCGATTSVSIETAREYARRQYRCQRCLDKEVVSRAAVAKALSVEYNRPENTIYDSWGRVKLLATCARAGASPASRRRTTKAREAASSSRAGTISSDANRWSATYTVANVSRQPKELTPEEKRLADAKRWEEKMRQDYFNSVKQHPSFEERVAAEKAKKAAEDAAKQQAQAESALKWAIDSFECYSRPNRADWLRTNQFRADLRKIEVRVNGKRCAVRTLAAVREANRARKPGLARWPWHSGHDPVPAGRPTTTPADFR